jgi:hypothetical protein
VEERKYEESEEIDESHTDRDAKKARKKATKNGAEATMDDTWQLKCTYTSCTAGVGGAPGPEKDVQPVQQDQQPSRITCKITQPATIPAAVAS